jgi:hypothetical protein
MEVNTRRHLLSRISAVIIWQKLTLGDKSLKKATPTKKKVGRPAKYQEPRVSIAARLQSNVYDRIKEEAERKGRSISEQIEHRLTLSFQWEDSEGAARKFLEETMAVQKSGFKAALRHAGYIPIHDINGTFWAEPGMEVGKFTGVINPAIEEVIERVVMRALKKASE